jgi:hypothetical protein
MSLKAVHYVLVSSAIVLCFGLGAWEIQTGRQGGTWLDWVIGTVALGSGAALVVYFRQVMKKLRAYSCL